MAQAQTSPWAGVPYNPDVTQAQATPWAVPTEESEPSTELIPQQQMETPKLDLHAHLPPVFAPTPKANPQDEITGHLQGNLEKDYEKDASPWGSPTNHPGFLGKLVHGLSVATGGNTRRGWEEQGIAKELNDVVGQQSENTLRGAQTGDIGAKQAETEGETADQPQKFADTHALAESQVAEHNAQAAALLHPQAKTAFEAWQVQNPGKPIEEWLKAQQAVKPSPNVRPDTPEQQYLDEYATTHPGSSVADAEKHYMLDTQRPPQVTPIMVMVPNANGGQTATVVRPGSEVAPGAQTMAGVNAANTPTTTQRTAAGRAEAVVAMAPDVINEISSMSGELGPMMGRWNDFMQGKLGSDNPKFAGLRTDLMMLSTAVALAHAQGRLPENLRTEFEHAINAPKQTPENLKATIQHILPWMQKMQQQGGKSNGQQPPPAPKGGATLETAAEGATATAKDGSKWKKQGGVWVPR